MNDLLDLFHCIIMAIIMHNEVLSQQWTLRFVSWIAVTVHFSSPGTLNICPVLYSLVKDQESGVWQVAVSFKTGWDLWYTHYLKKKKKCLYPLASVVLSRHLSLCCEMKINKSTNKSTWMSKWWLLMNKRTPRWCITNQGLIINDVNKIRFSHYELCTNNNHTLCQLFPYSTISKCKHLHFVHSLSAFWKYTDPLTFSTTTKNDSQPYSKMD